RIPARPRRARPVAATPPTRNGPNHLAARTRSTGSAAPAGRTPGGESGLHPATVGAAHRGPSATGGTRTAGGAARHPGRSDQRTVHRPGVLRARADGTTLKEHMMSPLFKFGNGSKERDSSEEMKEILTAMQQERVRQESAAERITLAAARLLELGEPVERATA